LGGDFSPPRIYIMDRRGILKELIKNRFSDKPIKGIEIGCLRGSVDGYLLKEFPNLYLVTIDPSPVWPDLFETCKGNLSRLRIMNTTSDEAFKILKREYNFVFIDGDHSYDQCRRDIFNYLNLLLPSGILCGHNLGSGEEKDAHPGVLQAVYDVFTKERVHQGDDAMWWVYV